MTHLKNNNLLSDCQYGFRENRGCILQLLKVLDEWSLAVDKGPQIDCVYLDFQKAFDTVPHKRLLYKLESLGISGNLLKWLENFLTNRRQRVVLNGIFSDWKSVSSGIPQGSVLGLDLFIIFINDLPDFSQTARKLIDLKKDLSDLDIVQLDLFSVCD